MGWSTIITNALTAIGAVVSLAAGAGVLAIISMVACAAYGGSLRVSRSNGYWGDE